MVAMSMRACAMGTQRSVQRLAMVLTMMAGALSCGCASVKAVDAAGSESGMNATNYEVAITRTAVLPHPARRVFDYVAAEDVLPKVLTGYGPLPAVVGTSGNTGPWDTPGSARIVHLADGTALREAITHYAPPAEFAYRVWDFGHPVLRRLARHGRGVWTFTEADGSTHVTWTYTFTARGAVAAVPLSVVVGWLWRGYMQACLDNVRHRMAVAPASR